jgi:hypothetical protein
MFKRIKIYFIVIKTKKPSVNLLKAFSFFIKNYFFLAAAFFAGALRGAAFLLAAFFTAVFLAGAFLAVPNFTTLALAGAFFPFLSKAFGT